MASSQESRLQVAKEITLATIEKAHFNFGSNLGPAEYNDQLIEQVTKIFKSVHETVNNAEKDIPLPKASATRRI
ncbi:hypothetical protein BSK59_08345 [Paenibacillus odorifer]|uniref:hypothetical protein n=1 Tax=Paenibacillus TaxID=44249 RepID=UPI00096F6926|nr:hypothetical protein [Paenibacillus odorifer]OME58184.1 hypothetical protein BSK59_08345 [Paenibacillus odorifer]